MSVTVHESRTEYEYDLSGNITAMTDAEGRRVRFEYDGAGNVVKTIYPDESCDLAEYDQQGAAGEGDAAAGCDDRVRIRRSGEPDLRDRGGAQDAL